MTPGSNLLPTSHPHEVADRESGNPLPTAPSRHHEGGSRTLHFGVLTTSDTHTEDDDESGHLVRDLLVQGGHEVRHYRLVANSVADIRETLSGWLSDTSVEAIITIGGTGVSSRDVTVEALESWPGIKRLEGFGSLYRMLSFSEVGALAAMSRAGLYVLQNRPIFAVPGSERACRLALGRLILPMVQHLVEELER
jgi:molybdenum cofactor biosynthesis protein B